MRVWDRILLIISSLVGMGVCLCIIAFIWGILPFDYLMFCLDYLVGKWQLQVLTTIALALICFLFLRVMFIRIRKRGLTHKLADGVSVGTNGDVKISAEAIGDICTQVVKQMDSVNNATCSITQAAQDLAVSIKVQCTGSESVPTLADRIKREISQMLSDTCGINNSAVSVMVEHIDGRTIIPIIPNRVVSMSENTIGTQLSLEQKLPINIEQPSTQAEE